MAEQKEKYDYDPANPKEGDFTDYGPGTDDWRMPKSPPAPKLTYRYAQKQAMERGDAPTYFMRKTTTRKRGTKR